MIGTDSHTPNAAGLGMLAIGVGGDGGRGCHGWIDVRGDASEGYWGEVDGEVEWVGVG